MDLVPGGWVICDAHAGVDEDTEGLGEGIVGVDEAAFGAFKVRGGEGIVDTTEAEVGVLVDERGSGHDDCEEAVSRDQGEVQGSCR